MSEDKQPTQPDEPTPDQQAKQVEEKQRTVQQEIHGRFVATDMAVRVTDLLDGFFNGGRAGNSLFGKTNFEDQKLNDMLNLLDSANPADLEHASASLKRATKALNDAAKDLADAVAAPDWKGEGAEAFRSYGAQLVSYAYKLGNFANAVGAQMEVASTGLASVRNSKPPRDGRLVQKTPDEFELPERTQDNKEYQQAVQVEKDRQEAINQMNRLASFYSVSESTLASQEPPPLPKPLNAAVPPPAGARGGSPVASAPSDSGENLSGAAVAESGGSRGAVGGEGSSPRSQVIDKPVEPIGASTSVQVDSVLTPTAPSQATGTTPPAPQSTTSGPVTGQVPPVPTNFGTTRLTPPTRAQGTQGVARAGGGPGTSPAVGRSGGTGTSHPSQAGRSAQASGVGRPVSTGSPSSATGRSGPVAGRPGIMGGGTGTGRAGAASGNGPVTGRAGMPGQTAPVSRQTPSSTTRAGHSNGIVGGTPQRATNGTTGSRIPRATVIGAEGATTGRAPAARPSQAGVIRANQGGNTSRPTGRGTPSTNGVVGTPRSAGAASAGGRPPQSRPRNETTEQTSTRPDYLTEDEETWASRRRGAVPPVID
ncbi:hypothetical protein [Streptomyces sp. NPDC015131]|uniref:hypothetical protein n=1 Tax=Streptomyces sp. NPDC015131 TaxID=3364941 RepID=UPI0037032230